MRHQQPALLVLPMTLLTLALLLFATGYTAALYHPPQPFRTGETYAEYGTQAVNNLLRNFYTDGYWKRCITGCQAENVDWGADALTSILYLRWKLHQHDPAMVGYLRRLATTALFWPGPCQRIQGCTSWSDTPLWDAVAMSHEYEATGMTDRTILSKAETAFAVVDGAGPGVYLLGACNRIPYQLPGGGLNRLKTLETTSNYIKAALLLYGFTHDASYLRKAEAAYSSARQYFLDPALPLYTVYVFDDGTSCYQVPGRFFASVNGNMIENGLLLAQATGQQSYRQQALDTAQAVADHLSDAAGVFANLQAENDTSEPLIEAMNDVATQEHQSAAILWLLAAASASVSSLNSDGAYDRFFDGPPQVGTSTSWQSSGGYALAVVVAELDPGGIPATTSAWARATSHPGAITTDMLPASITFTGTGISLIGTLGEVCCEPGHARVFIDGHETVDTTGIWQGKSSPGISIANTVLFAWRWPTTGRHTIQILPGIYNAKEGGSFIDISSYLVAP